MAGGPQPGEGSARGSGPGGGREITAFEDGKEYCADDLESIIFLHLARGRSGLSAQR